MVNLKEVFYTSPLVKWGGLRFWQRMGFGIESKTDYAFLHDVLRESLPYYAYDDMQRMYPETSSKDMRRAQLLFRIANAVQPREVRIEGVVSPYRQHVRELLRYAVTRIKGDNAPLLFVEGEAEAPLLHGISAAIVMDIDSCNEGLWQQIVSSQSITYDMKTIGVALFPKNRYPEHYII